MSNVKSQMPNVRKAGFVVLAGRSNAGKSTLLNALVGSKIAITTPKPQTTRHAIQGVLHHPEGQMVFVDSPGILMKKHDALTDSLNRAAREALRDIDVIVYVVDPTRAIGPEEEAVMRMVKASGSPVILAINKMDERGRFVEDYRALAPEFDAVVEISALRGTHLKNLVAEVLARLPEGEPLYPEHQLTNMDSKTWLAELIREKVFLSLQQELPYTVTVEVDEVEERASKSGEPVLYVHARVLTDTDQHKKMIIGSGGRTVRRIGSMARRELEQVNGMKVYLDLEVETEPHWFERLG